MAVKVVISVVTRSLQAWHKSSTIDLLGHRLIDFLSAVGTLP